MSATMHDIAARAGTSVAAVSVTLNGAKSKTLRVGSETRARIEQAAEELGYRRNPSARALVTGRTHVIGIMLPNIMAFAEHDPFFSLVTTGVTACAGRRGYNVMLFTASAGEDGTPSARMIDRRVDGVILVSPSTDAICAECIRQGISVVSVAGGPESAPLSVDSDDFAGALTATRHLLGLGHRRIAHLAGRAGISTTAPRLEGYKAGLREAGIEFDPGLCLRGDFNRADGYASTIELLNRQLRTRPTAIFAANDLSAHGALDAIHDAGLSTPGDIAVVGYDDTWYATVARPALTTVQMSVSALGERAAAMLIDSIESGSIEEPHAVLPTSLTVRESCGASNGLRRIP